MNLRSLLTPAAFVLGAALLAGAAAAQNEPGLPQNPYGGTTVADVVAQVNDQVITNMDYNRALQDLEQEAQQRGGTMQQESEERQDLLRNLIDQKLWLSKGKQLGITGDDELIKRLDDLRKQYHLASIDDLQKEAEEQGVSWADFKANLRDQIVTQDVMRQEVGNKIEITPGEARQYYEQHKQEYVEPESEHLSEILISTAPKSANSGAAAPDDPAQLAAAKAKADDIEARLNAGGSFAQLARSFSDGSTAGDGGDLGVFHRSDLAGELAEKTFVLRAGQWTAPILTRQGYVILEVTQHTAGGVQPFSAVENQAGNALFESRMEPAIRAYLTQMRDEAFIDIAPGYADSGASPNESKPVFSAYVPPAPKKRHKIERTRYREVGSRGKSRLSESALPGKKKSRKTEVVSQGPGKKEKIRYGQAPRETLPPAANSNNDTENGGALPESAYNNLEGVGAPGQVAPPPEHRTRYWDLARQDKEKKDKEKQDRRHRGQQTAPFTPTPPTAAEVAARVTQSAPLGLNGNTAAKHKKKSASTGKKVRFSQEKEKQEKEKKNTAAPLQPTPVPPVAGAPAPATAARAITPP